MGKAMAGMMLVWAELDNNIKSERTIDGMKTAFERGHWPWQAPIGYGHRIINNQKKLVLLKGFKAVLGTLFTNAASGLYTRTELAQMLNNDGYASLFGSEATAKSVDKILKKKFYYGVMTANNWNMEGKGIHDTVTDEQTWYKANNAIYKTPIRNTDLNTNEEFPLRRFVLCGSCNKPMTGSFSKGRKELYPYYHCARKECINPLRISREATHNEFISYLNKFQLNEIQQKLLQAVLLKKVEDRLNESEKVIDNKRVEIEKIRTERRATVRAEDKGLIDSIEAKTIINDLRTQEAVLELELSEDKIDYHKAESVINFAVNFLTHTGNMWDELDLTRKRKLQSKIFPLGVYYKDGNFGTAQLSQSFKLIATFAKAEDGLVTPREVESRLAE